MIRLIVAILLVSVTSTSVFAEDYAVQYKCQGTGGFASFESLEGERDINKTGQDGEIFIRFLDIAAESLLIWHPKGNNRIFVQSKVYQNSDGSEQSYYWNTAGLSVIFNITDFQNGKSFKLRKIAEASFYYMVSNFNCSARS